MKITIARHEEVSISRADMLEATRAVLSGILSPGEYLRDHDGKKCLYQDDPSWLHGSISEEFVREASEVDLAAMTLLEHLKSIK